MGNEEILNLLSQRVQAGDYSFLGHVTLGPKELHFMKVVCQQAVSSHVLEGIPGLNAALKVEGLKWGTYSGLSRKGLLEAGSKYGVSGSILTPFALKGLTKGDENSVADSEPETVSSALTAALEEGQNHQRTVSGTALSKQILDYLRGKAVESRVVLTNSLRDEVVRDLNLHRGRTGYVLQTVKEAAKRGLLTLEGRPKKRGAGHHIIFEVTMPSEPDEQESVQTEPAETATPMNASMPAEAPGPNCDMPIARLIQKLDADLELLLAQEAEIKGRFHEEMEAVKIKREEIIAFRQKVIMETTTIV